MVAQDEHSIICPKCRHPHTPSVNHQADSGERHCENCQASFVVSVECRVVYYTQSK